MKKVNFNLKRLIVFAVLILLFIWLLNPSWIPFIGEETRDALSNELAGAFSSKSADSFGLTLPRVLTLFAVLAITWGVYLIVAFVFKHTTIRTARAKTICGLLQSFCKYAALLISIFWGLSVLGVNTTALFATVGIASLIIGFGAQSLIEDIFTGLAIIFEGQYNVGDILILDNFRGKVVSIGVRTTVLMDIGGNLKIVNNSDVRNLQNRSHELSAAICDVQIGYDEKLERVEKLIEKRLIELKKEQSQRFVGDISYLGVQELGSSGVTLRIVARVNEKSVFDAQRTLNREIKLLFDANNVTIPYTQITLHSDQKEQ